MSTEVLLPKIGFSMNEGVLTRWLVEDGATVPLFYENRTPALELVNPDLNDDLYRLIEDAGLDEDQEGKPAEQQRHIDAHHIAHGGALIAWSGRGRHGQFGLDVSGDGNDQC